MTASRRDAVGKVSPDVGIGVAHRICHYSFGAALRHKAAMIGLPGL